MDILRINVDFFTKQINPMNTYALLGDKLPEMEIKSDYLNYLINKGEKKLKIICAPNNRNNPKLPDDISVRFLPLLYSQGEYNENSLNFIQLTKEQMKKFKLQQNNRFIRSFNRLHPFSIFYGTKYDKLIKETGELTLPAPFYAVKNDWCKPEDTSFDSIVKGIRIDKGSGFVVDDPELKKKFSGILSDIIMQLFRVPFGHHISLNIKMFEPETVLSRYVKLFSYANVYLLQASEPNLSPYGRFKLVIAFLFSGLYIGCKQLKPFNPFIGETFQGEFPNGAKIYVENVTRKPLVARFLIRYKKKYEISGYWDLDVQTQGLGNEMTIVQKGPVIIKFPELNESFVGHIPFVKVVNARSESKRATLFFGSLICVDQKHNYKCWIEFNFNKKCFHEVRGCTMNYEFPEDYKYDANKEWVFGNEFKMDKDIKTNQKKTKMNDNYSINEKISGSFIQHLKIGDDIIWDITKNLPDPISPVKYCIPSDGRFREDLNWLYRSFYFADNNEEEEIYREIGMKWKVMMEEFNRWERKRRMGYNESNGY